MRRQQPVSGFLDYDIASEPTGILDDDRFDAALLRASQEVSEALPLIDRICNADSGVIEFGDDFDLSGLGVAADRIALPLVGVAADIGG